MSGPPVRIPRRAFLTTAPLLAAASVGRARATAPVVLRAGAATSDITPPIGATNGGIISRGGPVVQVHDELRVRCLALDDGTTPLAITVCDVRMIGRDLIDRARRLAASDLGWPVENLLVSATHTHAAPALVGMYSGELDRWYADFVALRIADAIRRAARNLAPARAGWAAVDKPEHVFNRRWKVRPGKAPANPFGDPGEAVVMNPGRGPDLIEPAGPVDPRMALLSVRHADGRPLALVANYGLHYVGSYESGRVSADYFAIFARRVEELLGATGQHPPFVALMSNGASGDVNNIDFRGPAGRHPPWERMREVADDLAAAAVGALGAIEHRDDRRLAVATTELELDVRRPDRARLDWARDMVATIADPRQISRPQLYAQEALELSKFPPRVSLRLQAVRVGELGIAAVPCEVFAETGLEIRRQSPLKPTFTVELANGYHGYLPTPRQHVWGGYETWPARSSYLEVEASERIREGVVSLLERTT